MAKKKKKVKKKIARGCGKELMKDRRKYTTYT